MARMKKTVLKEEQGKWTDAPEEDSKDEDISEPKEFKPLKGYTEDDMGWMNIRWRIVQLLGFYKMTEIDD
ncbi:unnamed protein product [Penicillium roqueforti FM164]|uniref:Uncharacterized protein n=1 Tax=Penicillium roqueforti (strain FM164) TaxID=1365484 RepID=W6QLX1_PENRF|nr:unnamed protein product [Penicillium roqueforti FM164]